MRGRKPTPTAIKLVTGNPGKRPLNNKEPRPRIRVPRVPSHLDEAAKIEWRRIARELKVLGLVTSIDRAALAAYCQAYSRWSQAEESLAKVGLLIKTSNGNVVQNPLVGIANRSMELMHRFLSEFGMTPSSRSRLSVEPSGKLEQDPAEEFFD